MNSVPYPMPSQVRVPNNRTQANPPRPIMARGQMPQEDMTLRIPSPSELGIRLNQTREDGAPELDWNQVRRKLEGLGVTRYRMEKNAGGYSLLCQLGNAIVEGTGSTETQAVDNALAKVRANLK